MLTYELVFDSQCVHEDRERQADSAIGVCLFVCFLRGPASLNRLLLIDITTGETLRRNAYVSTAREAAPCLKAGATSMERTLRDPGLRFRMG